MSAHAGLLFACTDGRRRTSSVVVHGRRNMGQNHSEEWVSHRRQLSIECKTSELIAKGGHRRLMSRKQALSFSRGKCKMIGWSVMIKRTTVMCTIPAKLITKIKNAKEIVFRVNRNTNVRNVMEDFCELIEAVMEINPVRCILRNYRFSFWQPSRTKESNMCASDCANAWICARPTTDRDLECPRPEKANGWLCARQATDHDPESKCRQKWTLGHVLHGQPTVIFSVSDTAQCRTDWPFC